MADLESRPAWFTHGKNTPEIHRRRVRCGIHPSGRPLSADLSTSCGTCANLTQRNRNRTYYKCGLDVITRGPASDVKLKWLGCSRWEWNRADR